MYKEKNDPRIKVSDKNFFEFIKDSALGRTWSELKERFEGKGEKKISEMQISRKLRKMKDKDHTIILNNGRYRANPFNPKLNIKDPYRFEGFNRFRLERMQNIIHKALLAYWNTLAEKNKKILELKTTVAFYLEKLIRLEEEGKKIDPKLEESYLKNNQEYLDLLKTLDFKEHREFQDIEDVTYFMKEGYKFYDFKIKKE